MHMSLLHSITSVKGPLCLQLTVVSDVAPLCACSYQLNPLYVLITVIAYMMKDRMKEWGKRYLEPVCIKLGIEFPDRIVKVSPEPCPYTPPFCCIVVPVIHA